MLDWIVRRIQGTGKVRETPIGRLPAVGDLDLEGLELSRGAVDKLFAIDSNAWLGEANRTLDFLGQFRAQLPSALLNEHQLLLARLARTMV